MHKSKFFSRSSASKCILFLKINGLYFVIFAGVCLIESESAKDTSKVTNKANGGKGLGLFQVMFVLTEVIILCVAVRPHPFVPLHCVKIFISFLNFADKQQRVVHISDCRG